MKIKKMLCMICLSLFFVSTNVISQIPNQGFESWATDVDNNLNPIGWETTNSDPDVSVSQYLPAYSGNYSMLVEVFDPGFMGIGGFAMIAFPYSSRPSSISACLKTNIMPGDAVYVIVSLWQGDSIIAAPGNCTFVIDSTINQFTCFTFPISYQSSLIPDSANIIIAAGKSGVTLVGTQIIIDELAFGAATGVSESNWTASAILGQNFPNPSSVSASLPVNLHKGSAINFYLYDVLGKEVRSISFGYLEEGEHTLSFSVEDLINGIYQYSISGEDFLASGKMVVNK